MAKLPYVNVERIKILLDQRGMKFKYFCDKFGKDRTYFSNIKSGKNRIEDTELFAIADELDTTVDYLIDLTDDPSPKKKEPVEALDEVDVEVLAILHSMSVEDKLELLEYLKGKM